MEYFGDDSLALAALADVGNKVFVLILLYMLAMRWHYERAEESTQNRGNKLKSLALSLVREPVNLLIILALVLLSLNMNLSHLPAFLQSTFMRTSAMMTPMILIYIGMAVKLSWGQLKTILSFLLFRSGAAFLFSAIFLLVFPAMAPAAALVVIVFPQSACSFWPFAHISVVEGLEEQREKEQKTFDSDLALSLLACSLPFSTILILTICSIGTSFVNPLVLLCSSVVLLTVAFLPKIVAANWKQKTTISFSKSKATNGFGSWRTVLTR